VGGNWSILYRSGFTPKIPLSIPIVSSSLEGVNDRDLQRRIFRLFKPPKYPGELKAFSSSVIFQARMPPGPLTLLAEIRDHGGVSENLLYGSGEAYGASMIVVRPAKYVKNGRGIRFAR